MISLLLAAALPTLTCAGVSLRGRREALDGPSADEGGVASPRTAELVREVEGYAREGASAESVNSIGKLIKETLEPQLLKDHESDKSLLSKLTNDIDKCDRDRRSGNAVAKPVRSMVDVRSRTHKKCRVDESGKFKTATDCNSELNEVRKTMKAACDSYAEVKARADDEAAHKSFLKRSGGESTGGYLRRIARRFCGKGLLGDYNDKEKKCSRARAHYKKKHAECDKLEGIHNGKKEACDTLQKQTEGLACQYTSATRETCASFDSCYKASREALEEAIDSVKKKEKDRKVEWRVFQRIECLLTVLGPGAKSSSKIDKCKKKTHSTDHLDIKYPKVPPREKCDSFEDFPGTNSYAKLEQVPLPKNAKGKVIEACQFMVPPKTLYDEIGRADARGWSDRRMTLSSDGKIHGLWGRGHVARKSFKDLPPHNSVDLKLRFWAVDSWDGEAAVVKIDGKTVWRKNKRFRGGCRDGWVAYPKKLPNPWGRDRANHKCYYDVEVTAMHYSTSMKVEVTSTLNQNNRDESWGFSDMKIMLAKVDAPEIVNEVTAFTTAGWNSRAVETGGEGKIHGLFGRKARVTKLFTKLPKHRKVHIMLRYWAVDSWDREWAEVRLDNRLIFRKQRTNAHHCSNGWLTYTGMLPNPWGGQHNRHKCYVDIDVTVSHSHKSATLTVGSSINQHVRDESFGFSKLRMIAVP
eukprot:TRINITY_DN4551_c0_g1_i1.p1 TRINITY_DN4551_c0_g1~~TRINITY_DN4551_c0_g1_i1.p1  ORF type:complete len:714 (+),score=117.80 TRINITY_DN4551_c0_g1_i1:66-2144(+)